MPDLARNRWWVYQRERFPLVSYVPLVVAFSFSAVSFSAHLRGRTPSLTSVGVAFAVSLCFFGLLRIADEFKDFDDDSRFRPYRPVPRGLVKLPELARIGVAAAVFQLLAAAALDVRLLVLLAVAWGYFALMSKEFFVATWLRAHPFTYLWSHMLVMPLIDLFATACDWLPGAGRPMPGIAWFLGLSFFNGVVIEVGRKLRAPEDEEEGVDTYTAVWGRGKALTLWLAAMAFTAACAVIAGAIAGVGLPVAVLLACLLAGAVAVAARFARSPVHSRARLFEPFSGLWTVAVYLSLGVLPLVLAR